MLTDDILFLKAEIALRGQDVDEAVKYFEEIRQTFAFDLLADDAIFKLGELYQYDYKDLEKAKLCYEQIILNYKDSLYTNEARKRFRELRGDLPVEAQ
jgi:TolA-binding protein